LAANTSTCTPKRGPSDRAQLPVTGPLADSVNRGPVPIGLASLSSDLGICGLAGAWSSG
jgi:hypothetical protein